MRNGRRISSEINMTPLLDVLFSILFIVMMTGSQNEQGIKKQYQDQVIDLEQKNDQLTDELTKYKNEITSYDKYQSEAIILTINNVIRNNSHCLMIYRGTAKSEIGSIQMGLEKTENTKARIESLILELVEEADNQPIYIIFYCDKKNIYTAEYHAVCEMFNELQANNKEVFFKVMQEETE